MLAQSLPFSDRVDVERWHNIRANRQIIPGSRQGLFEEPVTISNHHQNVQIGIRSGISSGLRPKDTDLLHTTREFRCQKVLISLKPQCFGWREYQHGPFPSSTARHPWEETSMRPHDSCMLGSHGTVVAVDAVHP